MKSDSSRQLIYEKESPLRLLVKLSVPSVVSSLIMTVYNMADVYFIGQIQDPLQVAAVSLCGPLFTLLSGIGVIGKLDK